MLRLSDFKGSQHIDMLGNTVPIWVLPVLRLSSHIGACDFYIVREPARPNTIVFGPKPLFQRLCVNGATSNVTPISAYYFGEDAPAVKPHKLNDLTSKGISLWYNPDTLIVKAWAVRSAGHWDEIRAPRITLQQGMGTYENLVLRQEDLRYYTDEVSQVAAPVAPFVATLSFEDMLERMKKRLG